MTKQIIYNFYKVLFDEETANHVSDYNVYLIKIFKYFDAISETIDENEVYILKNLFNINKNSKSIDELSKELNLTVDEIDEIKAKAIRKLKHPSRSKYAYSILLKTSDDHVVTNDISRIYISDIDISVRTYNILFRNNIFTIKDLSEVDDKYLLENKIGNKGLEEVKEIVKKYKANNLHIN